MAAEYAILFKMALHYFNLLEIEWEVFYLDLQLHYVNLYQAATLAKCFDGVVKRCKSLKNDKSKLTQLTSRDMRDLSLPIHESVKSACQNWTSRA